MPGKVTLEVVAGASQGEAYVFKEHDSFLFGRLGDCHICLPDDNRVSRHHFLLEVNPPHARLRDLGSLNGTYVNGRKHGGRERHESPEEGAQRQYPEVDVHVRDEIRVGDTIMRVDVELLLECIECAKAIPEEDRQQCIWVGGTYICPECRQKIVAAQVPQPPARDPSVRLSVGADLGGLLRMMLNQGGRRSHQPDPDIPDYEIKRKLGEGGMGVVYLARHKETGEQVALKVMLSRVAVSKRACQQFVREIENMQTLRHKYLVELLGQGSLGDAFYFIMEYCPGGSLEHLMARRNGLLPLQEAGPIMLQALEGLAFAHEHGFVHRDLKPSNILLADQEGTWIAKVADLGLAKNLAQAGLSGLTITGGFAGTFPFMPREQLTNFKYVQPVSDVWSMGATFYYMLTGRFPRQRRGRYDPLAEILQGKIVPIAQRHRGIPSRLAEVIDRSLAVEPKDRYQDAGELRRALEEVL